MFSGPSPSTDNPIDKDVYGSAIQGVPSALVELGSIIEHSGMEGIESDALYYYQETSRIINENGETNILNPTSLPSSDFKKIKSQIIELTGNEQVLR